MNEKIYVSMTSWKQRIKYVSNTIFMMEQQTIIPDLIILNLAEEEFPNKEKDLPEDLILMKDELDNFEINWVKENTKAFKKVIPTIHRFENEKCFILSIDDDVIYDKTYVEFMVNLLLKNPNNFLTPGTWGARPHGYVMIYNPLWFKDKKLWKIKKEDMEKIVSSDEWTWYNLLNNGITAKVENDILKHIKQLKLESPLSNVYSKIPEIIRKKYIFEVLQNLE